MKKKRLLCAALALLTILMLAACTTTGSSGSTTSPPGTTGQTGDTGTTATTGAPVASGRDTFIMGMNAEPTSIDPAQSKDLITWIFVMQSYDTLIKYDSVSKEFISGLAAEWKVNEDSSEVEFTLRQGVKFHNGDTMTMDDVIFSLTRALESSFTAQFNSSIDRFEAIDETKLKVVLKYGYAPILEVLSTPCWGIVSQKAFEEAEAAGKDVGREFTCGTGAYILTEWRSGDRLIFDAFEDYYDGTPTIKHVEAILISDQTSGALALEDGTLDYYYGVQESDIEHLRNVPTLKVYDINEGIGLYDLTFNVTDGIFADKRLRQAVAYAINRDEILLGGASGNGVVNDCFCSTGSFGWLGDYEWIQQDLDKSRELLAEAGHPNGIDVVFTQDSSKYYMPAAEVMQNQLKKVGINVTFEKLERAAWLDTVASNRQYEASLRSTTQTVADADYILTRRLTAAMLGGGNNYSGYDNPDFEALLVQARSMADSDGRKAIYRQCYDIIKEDVPVIPLYTAASQHVTSNKLEGWQSNPWYRNPWSMLYFSE